MSISMISGTISLGTPANGCTPIISSGAGFSGLGNEFLPGCNATTYKSGFLDFRYLPVPETVPPVPTLATRISTLPLVSSQISGPVVDSWTAGLAGLESWSTKKMPSSFANTWSLSAATAAIKSPPVFSIVSTITGSSDNLITSAPNALITWKRSALTWSCMYTRNLYPLVAAIAARPIPVFPLVVSTKVSPGLIKPFFSASSIMFNAVRSLMLWFGLKYSNFTRSFAERSCFFS